MATRIGFLTRSDAKDRTSFSGTHYHMQNQLKKVGYDVILIGPVTSKWVLITRFFAKAKRILLKKKSLYLHSEFLSKIFASKVRKHVHGVDLIFASNASNLIAYLDTNIPIIYSSDGSFNLLKDYYEAFSNLDKASSEQGEKIEQRAIDRAACVVLASDWAAKSVVDHYGKDVECVEVIPLGANLVHEVPEQHERKPGEKIKLLFIGVNWVDKGGFVALEAARFLRRQGISVELHVCGTKPPEGVDDESLVLHGFLNKNDPEEASKLFSIFSASDFFILPTKFECYGLVFAEACAFGLPCLGTSTGGVSTIVHDDVNGYLFEEDATGEHYGKRILEVISEEGKYEKLSNAAFNKYRSDLNWEAWGNQIRKRIDLLINTDHNE